MDETLLTLWVLLGGLALLDWVINAVLYVVRFMRRVRRKTMEPAFGLLGKKVFLLWTWFVFFPLLLITVLAATVLFVVVGNIWLSFLILVLGVGLAVSVWLIWAIGPLIVEDVSKKLKP